VNNAAIALPKRLLRIRRQAARLAELRCIRAAAELQRVVQAEQAAQARIVAAETSLRERCRSMRLVEEMHASRHEIDRLTREVRQLQDRLEVVRADYEAAVTERRKADGEVEVLEKLLERRLDELHRKTEQRKQQFADEWTMRRWNGGDAVGQEAAR
jgi:flagellar biosynthesis chaperone FliJ